MGLKAGLQILQQTGKAVSRYTDDVVGLGVRNWTKPTSLELKGLRLANGVIGDTINIAKKSPFVEFKEYLKRYKICGGEDFIPTSTNPNSLFMEYFNYRKGICVEKTVTFFGKTHTFPAKPKIILGDESPDNYIISLKNFLNFVKNDSKLATKEQYYTLMNEYASLLPAYCKRELPMLRPEIAENADRIFKWKCILEMEEKGAKQGEIIYHKFFDKNLKEKALNEYVEFVEKITGKKVLIGSPTRMGFAVNSVTLYNDPNVYRDFDYILWGHGTGSSLAPVDNPNCWRFSDTGESIYKFLEKQPNAKGKKVLVTCCEQDGDYWRALGRYTGNENIVPNTIKRTYSELYDKDGIFRESIGNTVSTSLNSSNGAKICNIGDRKILGIISLKNGSTDIESFISSKVGDFETKYFNL